MASLGNHHCASCIGTLSFPITYSFLPPSWVFIGSACRSELHSRWRRWCIVHCMVPHHLTWHRNSHVSPTCRTDAGSGPPPLNSLTFRPVVGQRRRSCLSCRWSKGVEWPAKRCYVGLVAVGVQEQAEDILVPPLLRHCLTLNDVSFSLSLSPVQKIGPCNSFFTV